MTKLQDDLRTNPSRGDNLDSKLIGFTKKLLKQTINSTTKDAKKKQYDVSERFISHLEAHATPYCVDSTIDLLRTKDGKAKRKELFTFPSLKGAAALASASPLFRHWIRFLPRELELAHIEFP